MAIRIVPAKFNAIVVFELASRTPRIIAVDVNKLADPAWNPPGHVRIDIPVSVYNESIKNPAGVHIDLLAYAQEQFDGRVGGIE